MCFGDFQVKLGKPHVLPGKKVCRTCVKNTVRHVFEVLRYRLSCSFVHSMRGVECALGAASPPMTQGGATGHGMNDIGLARGEAECVE